MNSKFLKILGLSVLTLIILGFYLKPQTAHGSEKNCAFLSEPGIVIEISGANYSSDTTMTVPSGTVLNFTVYTYAEPSSYNSVSYPGGGQQYFAPDSGGRSYVTSAINSTGYIQVYAVHNCDNDVVGSPAEAPEKTVTITINVNKPEDTPEVCSINSFTADNSPLAYNTGTNLRFSLSGDFPWSISLLQGGRQPSQTSGGGSGGVVSTGNLTETHVYRLICGTAIRDLTVNVNPAPPPPPTETSRYRCSGATCIQDDAGGTTTSPSCDNACVAPPPSVNTCQDRNATNFGGALPCTYTPMNNNCSDPNATNYGYALPCVYSTICKDLNADNYNSPTACTYSPICGDGSAINLGGPAPCIYLQPSAETYTVTSSCISATRYPAGGGMSMVVVKWSRTPACSTNEGDTAQNPVIQNVIRYKRASDGWNMNNYYSRPYSQSAFILPLLSSGSYNISLKLHNWSSKTVTLTFPSSQYLLTLNTAGTGSGAVSGGGTYGSGSVVAITATPNAGSTFAGWSGSGGCVSGSVTMDTNKTCTATFNGSVNSPPTAPTITGPVTGITSTPLSYSFVSTDAQNDQLRYGIDWNMDGIADEWLPSGVGYVNSGVSQGSTYSWPTTGSKTFRALAQDTKGANSAWTNYTVTINPALNSDLTAGNIDPNTATAGIGRIFSTTITNGGISGTVIGFNNLFQVRNGAGIVTTISVNNSPALGASQSGQVYSNAYTFPIAGVYSVQACADNGAVITESNEGNNCGPWTLVNVVPPPPTSFSSTCAPSGASATISLNLPAGYTQSYLRVYSGSGPFIPATQHYMVPETYADTGSPFTFAVVPGQLYTWWAHTRFTNAIYSTAVGGTFTCSAPSPSGTITATGCTIATGASSCNAVLDTWTTANRAPGATISVTKDNPDSTVSNAVSGANVSVPVGFGPTTFRLLHNATQLSAASVTASCNLAVATWNGAICQPIIPTHNVEVSKTPPAGGTVTSGGNVINCGSVCSAPFNENSTVTLTAIPKSSYWKFDRWTGDCSGTSPVCTFVVNGAKNIQAEFSLRDFQYHEF